MVRQKVVAMETQYKLAARSAQLLSKEAPPEEAARVMATMATAKSQLSKVGVNQICNGVPRCPVLSDDLWYLHSGERKMPLSCEGMSYHSASAGGNGETHYGLLPITGAGQLYHLCCRRSRYTNLEPAKTKVAG